MNEAKTIDEIEPGIFRWEIFSEEHGVELTSHALLKDRDLYIFDPIPLAATALNHLISRGVPQAIILTNDNHERAAAQWREKLDLPIFASYAANLQLPQVYRFLPGIHDWFGWEIHPIAGGSAGELGFFDKKRSLMIVGDAVTNLRDYGLLLLTKKYCEDQPTLRHNLRQLLYTVPFDRLLCAHGRLVGPGAAREVEALLSEPK